MVLASRDRVLFYFPLKQKIRTAVGNRWVLPKKPRHCYFPAGTILYSTLPRAGGVGEPTRAGSLRFPKVYDVFILESLEFQETKVRID